MSAIGDGADESWIGRLSRLLGAREEDQHAALAARAANDLARDPTDIALLDAAVSGMPDPVVVLGQDGRVLAFNTEAIAIAPALRRGEPGSIALRMPELVDSIRSAILMERPGRVFSREQLLDGVWGSEIYIDERTVDVHIGRLRKALNRGREAGPIRTVRGAGYALDGCFGRSAA